MASPGPARKAQKRQSAQNPSLNPKKQKWNISSTDPEDADKKENERGLKDFLHGIIYQLKLLMLFSYCCKFADYSFNLYTEMSAGEKFDDVVLEYIMNNVPAFIFLQAKHSLSENKKITCADLRATDIRFVLHKYFTSYLKIKKNDKFKSGHKHFIINTNLGFKFDGQSDKRGLKKLGDLYFKFFDIKSNPAIELLDVGGDYYQLRKCTKTLKSWFEEKPEFNILAEILTECLVNKKKIDFNQALFKTYHSALVTEVIDTKNAKLAYNFINNKNLSSEAQAFRKTVLQIVKKTHKINKTGFLERMDIDKSLLLSKSFEKNPDSNNDPIFPDREVSVEDVKGFMKTFIFAVNQPNENKLGKKISQKIGRDFNLLSSDFAFNSLFKVILDWAKEKGSGPLTKKKVNGVLNQVIFQMDIVKTIGKSNLIIDELKSYGINFKIETLPEELSKFVKSSETVQKNVCILANSNILMGSIKVIQALQESCEYNDGFIFIKLSHLLLAQVQVMKIYKHNKMRLLIVVCEPQDKDVTQIYKLLSEHLQNKRLLLIGSLKHPLIKKFSSSDRSFVEKRKNRFSYLSLDSQQTVLNKEVTFQGHKIVLNKLVDDQQENIMNLILKSGILENKTQDIGNEIPISSGYDTDYYIDRNFQNRKDESKKYSTQDLLDKLKEDTHKKFMIITDTAGMGKSTVLTHLSLQIKEENPHFWVERIDLNANTEAFINHTEALTSDNVVEFIIDELLKLKTELEKDLFKHLLKERKVVLMLDAFDEICPTYEEKGIEFFKSLKNINLKQLWITTRLYFKNQQNPEQSLEDLFSRDQVELLAITPFFVNDQIEFLQKFWSQKQNFGQSKPKSYACRLINKLEESIGYNKEFNRNPLHLLMLAQVYTPDKSIKISFLDLKIKVNLFHLYQQFFDKKIDIYRLKGDASEFAVARTEQNKILKGETNMLKAYQHSAIKLIFPEQAIDILKNNEEKFVSQEEIFRSGIAVTNDGINFVHRTFAEFFAVQFIMQEIPKTGPNQLLLSFFLTAILYKDEFQMIRKFLNGFIEQSYQPNSEIKRLKNMGEFIKEAYHDKLINIESCSVLDIAARKNNSYIIKFLRDNLNVESCEIFSKLFIECYISSAIDSAMHCAHDNYDNDITQTINELFAWIANYTYIIDQHPLLKPNDSGYSPWTSAIFYSQFPKLKKMWDFFRSDTKYLNTDLKSELLLSKVNGEYLMFKTLLNADLNIFKCLWQFAEEIGAQQELLQCKNIEGRTIMQLMLLESYNDFKFDTSVILLLEMNLSLEKEFNQEQNSSKKFLLWLKEKLHSLYLELDGYQTIFYHVAYNGFSKIVDEVWRIAKMILNQNELRTLLFETDKNGNNKAWLLVALQCDGSPLDMARQLGTEVGLGDELYEELIRIQNNPEIVELKREILARKENKSRYHSADDDSTD